MRRTNGALSTVDGSATITGGNQQIWAAAGRYAFGPHSVGAAWSHSTTDGVTGVLRGGGIAPLRGESLVFDNFSIDGRYVVTRALSLAAAYTYTMGRFDTRTGQTRPKWNQVVAQADYALSKRTDAYLEGVYQSVSGGNGNPAFNATVWTLTPSANSNQASSPWGCGTSSDDARRSGATQRNAAAPTDVSGKRSSTARSSCPEPGRPRPCAVFSLQRAHGSKNAARTVASAQKCGETGHAVTFFLICLQRRRDLAFRSRHSFIWRTTGLRTCFTSCVPGLSRHAGRIRACRTHAPRVQRSQPLETNDEQNEPICGPGNLRAAGRLPPCGEDARECRHGADTLERSRRNGDGRRLDNPNSPLAKRSIYFDFDQYSVKPEFQSLLQAHADYLRSHPARHVLIQGNTDERGTSEYNLALGQRRSQAVMSEPKRSACRPRNSRR